MLLGINQKAALKIWKKLNGNFLAALFAGIAISVVSLAKVITFLLATYPVLVWAFFFGLIIASSVLIGKQVKLSKPGLWILLWLKINA